MEIFNLKFLVYTSKVLPKKITYSKFTSSGLTSSDSGIVWLLPARTLCSVGGIIDSSRSTEFFSLI